MAGSLFRTWCCRCYYSKSIIFRNTLLIKCDFSGQIILQVVSIENFVMVIINIYGYNSFNDNNILLDTLEKHIQGAFNYFPISSIVIGRDFNMIFDYKLDCWPPCNYNAVNVNLILFMQKFNLIDVRRKQNLKTTAYTWSNKSTTRKSWLDFWLNSSNLNTNKTSVNILTTPTTDHSTVSIFISLHFIIKPCRSSYWKLKYLLLKHATVKSGIKVITAEYWNKAHFENAYSKNWESYSIFENLWLHGH